MNVKLRSKNVPLRKGAGYSNAMATMAMSMASICTSGIVTMMVKMAPYFAFGLYSVGRLV